MSVDCPACGFGNPEGFKFCGDCGARLAAPPPPAGPAPSSPSAAEAGDGDRRQLTVLFADLVGSTALAERLDPEEVREVLRAYQAACVEVIERYGGHVAQYLGDGLLVYFGYPTAHGDDARRAVHAGLGILEAIQRGIRGARLSARVGVATGPVVTGAVGAGGKLENLAVGQTPNIAARMQSLAQPDQLLISGTTSRVVEGFFVTRPLGPQSIKGVSEPVEVFQVLGESGARSGFDAAVLRGLAPAVGRARELGLLRECLAAATAGSARVATVVGEAGLGKSRLLALFREELVGGPAAWVLGQCSPFYQHSAFSPLVELAGKLAGFDPGEDDGARLARVRALLERVGIARPDAAALLASFLGIPPAAGYRPTGYSPQRQKTVTMELLREVLTALSRERPLVLVVEDLHWSDPSTLEFLGTWVSSPEAGAVCTVLAYRPTLAPPWPGRPHHVDVSLDALAPDEVRAMVRGLSRKALPEAVVELVVAKTDGVPLFVEELTRTLLESGALEDQGDAFVLRAPLAAVAVPATLEDSLTARLDRLGPVRPVAQLASVVGRDFAYDLLRRVAEQDDASLARDLDRLVELNLLTCDGTPPEAVYTFRHALIQDAAYRSLVRGTRQQYHGRVAATLAEHFPQVAGQHPEVLAHHFTEAGRYDAAIPHWVRAGAAAMDRSAEVESIRHLERGIAAAERMAESPERVGRELELQTALGRAWSVYRGFGAPEVERAYTRAHELSSRAGETPQVFQVLLGLYAFYLVRGEFITALQVARRMMRFAERAAHPALLLGGHFAMGMVELWLGEFASSLEHHEQVIALEAQVPRQPASAARVDPGVLARAYAGLAAWHLGRPDTALAFGEQATAVARDLDHSYSEAEANFFNAWLHQLRGDAPRCRESAEAAVRLCRTGGFHFWLEPAAILLAWARARAPEGPGAGEEPAAVIRGAFDKYQAAGSRLAQSHYLTLLVDTLLGAGRPREAAAALREAQDAIRLTGEAPWEPEVQRLEGDVLLAGGEEDRLERAERCFRQALKTAGRQGALGNELRAAMALHRLAREAGRPPEDELLREVVGRFTEGHDTADLVAARRLLEGA